VVGFPRALALARRPRGVSADDDAITNAITNAKTVPFFCTKCNVIDTTPLYHHQSSLLGESLSVSSRRLRCHVCARGPTTATTDGRSFARTNERTDGRTDARDPIARGRRGRASTEARAKERARARPNDPRRPRRGAARGRRARRAGCRTARNRRRWSWSVRSNNCSIPSLRER
jgi:hypothetical protein